MISKSLPAEIRQIWKEIERLRARAGGHFVADSVAVELAQDAVGNILTDTTTVNFTYDDGTPTISADVIQSAIDHGNIAGLNDDDHTQYHNDTRGDVRYVQKSTFDANTILKADTDNTPVALTVAEQTLVGRITGGNIDDLSASDAASIVQSNIDHGALLGLSDDDHTQYILATGTRTGATSQAQTFTSGVIDSSLTASRLLASNGSKQLASVANLVDWIAGTENQITVTNDGDGTVTLSLPQNIHTAATPTFAGLIAPWLRPAADSTTALQLATAGGTGIVIVDTTNKIVTVKDSLIVNEDGTTTGDFRAESDTEANMLFLDASADLLYLGGSTVGVKVAKGGDTTFLGDGSGLPYGSCYGNEIGWTQANAAQDTWYEVSDADMADGELNLVTHDGSGKLTVSVAGRYLINYTCSAEVSLPGKHVQSGISVSGTESAAGISHYNAATANEQFNVSGTAILDLAANATIEISLRTTDTGTPDISVDHLNITVVMVGGS